MDKEVEMYTTEKIFSSGDGVTLNYARRIACTVNEIEMKET